MRKYVYTVQTLQSKCIGYANRFRTVRYRVNREFNPSPANSDFTVAAAAVPDVYVLHKLYNTTSTTAAESISCRSYLYTRNGMGLKFCNLFLMFVLCILVIYVRCMYIILYRTVKTAL